MPVFCSFCGVRLEEWRGGICGLLGGEVGEKVKMVMFVLLVLFCGGGVGGDPAPGG